MSTARNHGIREAKGEYIIFLDSDDWLEDNAVKVLLDTQLTHPDKLIVCNWYIVTIGGKDNNSFIRSKSFNTKTRTMTVVETINACTMIQFPLPTWAKIFSTELIRRYNLTFNERINYGEDQLFLFEYLVKTQGSIYLTEALFDILERSGSLTRSYHKGHESDTNTDEWLDWLPNIDEITPDVRTASCMYAARTYQSRISQAILQAESRSRIRVLQKKAQHLAKYLLSSKAVSTARKIYFVCMVYTPVILAKMFLFVKLTAMSLKRKLAAPDSDIVPYW